MPAAFSSSPALITAMTTTPSGFGILNELPSGWEDGEKEIKTLWKQAMLVSRVLAGLFHFNWREMLIDSPAFQKGKTTNSKNTEKQEQNVSDPAI